MPEKKVEVKVATDVELEKVRALEDTLRKLKQEKIKLDIEARTEELEATEKRIENLKTFLDSVNGDSVNIPLNVTDDDIRKAEAELEQLESEKIDLEIAVETGKLEAAKSEIEALDDTTIDVELDNLNALNAIDQISQGFDRLKTGVFELKDAFSGILASAGSQEMNKTFLEMNLGAQGAKSALEDINSIVANLPGDDTALQGLLSQATAQNAGITRQELEGMAVAATDYFSAMSFYGKSATEAQQDMVNYILAGNTAELERSPILQGHIDKLKEGTTIQERSQLLQDALNEAGWGGISQQDTYNNKLETFNGMLERGKYNLGGMFQEGAKSAMDFLIKLDEGTNGLVGMGIALAGFAAPLTDTLMGIGQMATGIKALKDVVDFSSILSKLSPLKTALLDVASAAKTAALGLLESGKNALIAGANAVKSGIMWAAEKTAKIASTVASYAMAAAQAVLNAVMSLNPIMLVVLALAALVAALIWAYNNVDWFREAVDNLGASLMSVLGPAIDFVKGLFDNFTSQLGLNTNDWTQAILGFLLFIPTLPAQLTLALLDAITQALGFGDSFVEALWNAATGAVDSFSSGLAGLSDALWSELEEMESAVGDFYSSLPPGLQNVALTMVLNWLAGSGEHSPGFMYDALEGELTAMVELPGQILGGLISSIGEFAMMMVQAFSFESVIGALSGLWSAIDGLWQYIMSVTTMIPAQVYASVAQIIAGIMQALAYIATLPGQVGAYLNSVISRVLSFASSFVSNIRSAASNAVSQFSSVIHGLSSALASELSNMINQALNFASNLASTLYNAGANAVSSFLSGMGAGSPGTMQRFLVWELNEMGRRTPLESKNLVQNIGKLGADVVDSFGQPDLSLGNVTGNGLGVGGVALGGDTVINIYGDVDSDKRVNEIIDAVRRELNWDNTTAGRTI